MKYTKYDRPDGKIIINIAPDIVYNDIIKNFKNYWSSVGTACIEIQYFEDDELVASLFINVHLDYGIYLNYSSRGEEKSSVFDKSKLNEIVWTKDVCDFSMGLFLPPELAWKGIKEFLETGTASKEIEWINPDDLPEGGNY
ncbi:MAG: hypothetical protein SPE43_08200 [Ruminococcus sp.]|nr:hypothetical protein [Oscillospiraceae bacterium]MDY4414328.1 hypothetical protein [Ruminococcus sp.]